MSMDQYVALIDEDVEYNNTEPVSSRRRRANFLSRLLFWSANELVRRGNQAILTKNDLEIIDWDPRDLTCTPVVKKFDPHWAEELQKHPGPPSLATALRKTFFREWLICFLLLLIASVLGLLTPIVYPYMFAWLEDTSIDSYYGYVFSVSLVISSFISAFFRCHGVMRAAVTGVRIRTILMVLVYEKSLRINPSQGSEMGKIYNLYGSDTQMIAHGFHTFNQAFVAPFQLVLVLLLLWFQLEWFAFISVAIIVVAFSVTSFLGRKVEIARWSAQMGTDTRIKLVNELVTAVRIIKLYAWEVPFLERVKAARSSEISRIWKAEKIRAHMQVTMLSAPYLMTFLTILCYSLDHSLSVALAYTTITLMRLIMVAFSNLPMLFHEFFQYRVSLGRVMSFVCDTPNLDHYVKVAEKPGIYMKDCEFQWKKLLSGPPAPPGPPPGMGPPAPPTIKETEMLAKEMSRFPPMPPPGGHFDHPHHAPLRSPLTTPPVLKSPLMTPPRRTPKSGSPLGSPLISPSRSPKMSPMLSPMISPSVSPPYPPSHPYGQKPGGGRQGFPPPHPHGHPGQSHGGPPPHPPPGGGLFGGGHPPPPFPIFDEPPVLTDVNIRVVPGKLTFVIGSVGSGKSTLLLACLGEVPLNRGTVEVQGSVAYVPQEAWIVNETVRENILLGKQYDEKLYSRVIHDSALEPDFKLLPARDLTEVGERGVNLSGGQKQRISIARALYSQAAVLIFDDPFACVDAPVARHIFENAIKPLKNQETTIFIATNNLSLVPHGDLIYQLGEGTVLETGTYDSLMKMGGVFAQLMEFEGKGKTKEEGDDVEDTREKKGAAYEITADDEGGKLIEIEEKEEGFVDWAVYYYFLKNGGIGFFIIVFILCFISYSANLAASFWIGYWSEDAYGRDNKFYIAVWGALYATLLFPFFTSVYLMVWSSLKSARVMFDLLVESVARARSITFDVTPVGRFLTRFSQDFVAIDLLLHDRLIHLLMQSFSMLIIAIAIAFGSFYIVPFIVIAGVFYFWFQGYFRRALIEVQRLEAIERSPIFENYSCTLHGITSIRSFGYSQKFSQRNKYTIFVNNHVIYVLHYLGQWFSLRLDWVASALVLVMYLALCLTRDFSDDLDIAFAGVALSGTVAFAAELNMLVIMLAEAEVKMNSIERVQEYTNLEPEAPLRIDATKPPDDWPSEGSIEFIDVSLRYRPDAPLVLKGINAVIKPGEKIGIVGRTGAGKTSLIKTIYRMIEPSGIIKIDGINILTLGLHDLRSKLALIPQDPTLFSGTVRYNLDPAGLYTDRLIWDALEKVHLKSEIMERNNGLDYLVDEGGVNFSLGQKQLLCLARALLRGSRVLVMDEATASVDNETDVLIQKMVRKHFPGTVLTIAHRLNTVMDSSRIIVMDKGKIEEFDTPQNLLKQRGLLYDMVQSTGIATARWLTQIANREINIFEFKDDDSD